MSPPRCSASQACLRHERHSPVVVGRRSGSWHDGGGCRTSRGASAPSLWRRRLLELIPSGRRGVQAATGPNHDPESRGGLVLARLELPLLDPRVARKKNYCLTH